VWLGCQQTPPELESLQVMLGQRLAHCGFISEEHPYQPHVTLGRKVSTRPSWPQCMTIEWPVDGFALVCSSTLDGRVVYSPGNRF
jgi:2'-5' RNA ligase